MMMMVIANPIGIKELVERWYWYFVPGSPWLSTMSCYSTEKLCKSQGVIWINGLLYAGLTSWMGGQYNHTACHAQKSSVLGVMLWCLHLYFLVPLSSYFGFVSEVREDSGGWAQMHAVCTQTISSCPVHRWHSPRPTSEMFQWTRSGQSLAGQACCICDRVNGGVDNPRRPPPRSILSSERRQWWPEKH